MKRTVATTLVLALPLSALLWLSGAVPLHVALGAMTLFVFVVMGSGLLLLRAAQADDMPVPAAWVLGTFATAIAVYALVQWFHLLAAAAFAIWTGFVVALGVAFRRHLPSRRLDIGEFAGLLLCGVATVMWCREVAEIPQILARERLLPAWIDYFIHGSAISHFGDPRAGRQSMFLADFPAPFYHYASYMLPAVFAGPLDLPGLPLATSVWLPLGFFTLCAGAYALGAGLAGPAGGIAAVAALTIVPDASNYGLRNGFFSFHWHLLAFPGAPYAIGVFLLSIALLQRWLSAGNPRSLLASACLAGGALLFRVHVFALGFPALLASAAMSTRFAQKRKLAFFGLAVGAFALFVFGFYRATDSLPALDLVPISFIACYVLLMLTAPTVYWDATELTVRPFVLLYAVIAVWTVAAFVNWLASQGERGARRLWPALLLASALGLLLIWPQTGKLGLLPKFQWGWRFYPYKVELGLPQAAAYLRRNSGPGDLFAVQGLKLRWVATDVAIQLASLTGMPAYL